MKKPSEDEEVIKKISEVKMADIPKLRPKEFLGKENIVNKRVDSLSKKSLKEFSVPEEKVFEEAVVPSEIVEKKVPEKKLVVEKKEPIIEKKKLIVNKENLEESVLEREKLEKIDPDKFFDKKIDFSKKNVHRKVKKKNHKNDIGVTKARLNNLKKARLTKERLKKERSKKMEKVKVVLKKRKNYKKKN